MAIPWTLCTSLCRLPSASLSSFRFTHHAAEEALVVESVVWTSDHRDEPDAHVFSVDQFSCTFFISGFLVVVSPERKKTAYFRFTLAGKCPYFSCHFSCWSSSFH